MENRKRFKMNFRFKKRYIAYVLIFMLIVFFIYKNFSNKQSYTLLPEEKVNITGEGQGLFVFYEYAPKAFRGLDFSKADFDENKRYRPDSVLMSITDKIRSSATKYLKISANKMEAEKDGKNESETDNKDDSLKERVDKFRTSFSTKGTDTPHKFPLFGDNKAVINLNEDGRRWEIAYINRVLGTSSLLSGPYGRVIKSLDGFESLISPEMLFTLIPTDLEGGSFESNKLKGLKFVEDRLFYLAVDLEESKSSIKFKQGLNYDLELENSEKIEGKLDLIKTDDQARNMFIFSIRNGYDKVKNKRFQKIKIYGPTINAFRIPLECLANDGNMSYCYKLNYKNIAQRVNLDIIKIDDNTALVNNIDEKDKSLGKLSSYDRILYKPESVKEGQMY